MLSRLKVEHYKSLFDVVVKLEPLTVFIGPNGSGKSNICEALVIVSAIIKAIFIQKNEVDEIIVAGFNSLDQKTTDAQITSFFWHGRLDYLKFEVESSPHNSMKTDVPCPQNHLSVSYANDRQLLELSNSNSQEKQSFKYSHHAKDFLITQNYSNSNLVSNLNSVKIYDFSPNSLNSSQGSSGAMSRIG